MDVEDDGYYNRVLYAVVTGSAMMERMEKED